MNHNHIYCRRHLLLPPRCLPPQPLSELTKYLYQSDNWLTNRIPPATERYLWTSFTMRRLGSPKIFPVQWSNSRKSAQRLWGVKFLEPFFFTSVSNSLEITLPMRINSRVGQVRKAFRPSPIPGPLFHSPTSKKLFFSFDLVEWNETKFLLIFIYSFSEEKNQNIMIILMFSNRRREKFDIINYHISLL